MSREIAKTIYSKDGSRRVVLFRRPDGTFGFEDQKYSTEPNERCWIPFGRYSESRTISAEDALREATGRIAWLAEERTGGSKYRLHEHKTGPAPLEISGLSVVCFSLIDARHHPTGATVHHVGGKELSTPAGVAICQETETSFYLFYCDVDWNPLTDTWHQSVTDAQAQAEWEFEGIAETWETS